MSLTQMSLIEIGVAELIALAFYWREGLLLISVTGFFLCLKAALNPVIKPSMRWAVLGLCAACVVGSTINLFL